MKFSKTLFAVLFLLFSSYVSHAQITNTDTLKKALQTDNKDTVAWVLGGTVNVGLNEGFLHNWPAGGELGSMTVNGLFSTYAVRMYHKHIWSNYLDMNYSLFYAYSNNFVPRKIDDRVELSSKYGYRFDTSKDFFLTALFNFKSQFTKAYDYNLPKWDSVAVSDFMSPAYFILATGMEYRKGSALQLFLSPFAGRVTIANKVFTNRAPEGAFGIEYGNTARFELGALFSGRYQLNVGKKFTYKTRLDLYANYLAKDKKDSLGVVVKKDNPGNADLLWDNQLSVSIAKYFNVALGVTVLYDNDIPYEKTYIDKNGVAVAKNEPGEGLGWVQMKQVFTFGIIYKF
jgi:hypothetical protein